MSGQLGSMGCSQHLSGPWVSRDSRNICCLEAKGRVPSPAERCQCPLLEVEGGAGFAKRVGWGRNDSLGKAHPCSQLQLPCSADPA